MTPQQHDEICDALDELRRRFRAMSLRSVEALPAQTTVHVSVQTHGSENDATVRAVDYLAAMLLHDEARTEYLDHDRWHHHAHGAVDPVTVSVFARVAAPAAQLAPA